GLRENRAGADRLVALLLEVPTAGGVERHDSAGRLRVAVVDVEARQQRQGDEALQGGAQIAAHHGRQPIDLAAEGEWYALGLLVVLELDGIQPGELNRDRRGAGDP